MGSFEESESKKAIAIAVMAENFGKELSPALASLWLDLLAPYDAVHVQAAVRAVIEGYEYKSLPPFAVLKRELDNLAGTSEQAVALQAEAEWALLQNAISRNGAYSPPDNLHPTTAHVLRVMGGWAAACQWETRYLDFKRRDFCELWAQVDGKTDVLDMGAEATRAAITQGTGPVRVAAALEGMKALNAGGARA